MTLVPPSGYTRSSGTRLRAPSTATGAVVVGGDYQGLGIVRSLGRRGVPVCVIDDEHSISRFSRYTTHAVRVPDLRSASGTLESVLDIGRRLDLRGWVLYPTREETVAAFSRHRPTLAEWYTVPTPTWSTIQWVWDKRRTYSMAKRLEIPIPRTWSSSEASDLDLPDAEPPLAIKPAIKEHFFYAAGVKAWRADSPGELRHLLRRAARLIDPAEIMVQEVIPGDGRQQFAYCAFFKDGEAIASMIVRRRRQHPPDFGRASTFVETVDVPVLETLATRFLRAIDYYGLAEVEFKLDPRDGRYKLLDVNARTWGYHSLGQRAGVDFPYLLYSDQLGGSVARCRAPAGVKWIRLVTDVPTAVVEMWRGRLDVRGYLASLRSFHTESVFSREDPLPGLAELALLPYLSVKRGF